MAKFKNVTEASKAGFKFSVHKLNQENPEDNGWHYFETAAEAWSFNEKHPDPINDEGGSISIPIL